MTFVLSEAADNNKQYVVGDANLNRDQLSHLGKQRIQVKATEFIYLRLFLRCLLKRESKRSFCEPLLSRFTLQLMRALDQVNYESVGGIWAHSNLHHKNKSVVEPSDVTQSIPEIVTHSLFLLVIDRQCETANVSMHEIMMVLSIINIFYCENIKVLCIVIKRAVDRICE